MAVIQDLNAQTFDGVVGSGTVLVDFWAPWCNPCRMLGTILEQVAKEAADDVIIGKVNVDENKELAAKFEVVNIPRLFLFRNGAIDAEFSGVQS